ncbi:MAG: hypothetical protein NTW28_16665 [Candidatus Solibacter sp.]|nr:hypothetical protein [Candidatus Solibacter sp.]
MSHRTLFGSLATTLTLLSLSTVPAYADFFTGFEPTTYAVGGLAGQNGWSVFGPAVVTVETSNVKTGLQAVFVDGGASATSQSGPHRADAAGSLVDLSADIFLASNSHESSWQFAALTFSGAFPFAGGIDVDATTNAIHVITAGYPVVGTLTREAWNHVDLVFDFTTQRYSFSLNGATLASGLAFCGDNSVCAGGPVAAYSSGLFDTFGGSGTNDSGFIDNYSVTTLTSPVPEPASVVLLGFAVALTTRRLRSARARS